MKSKPGYVLLSGVLLLAAAFTLFPEFIDEVLDRIKSFQDRTEHNKVFLSFNQDKFTSGDTAFFSAHIFSEDIKPITRRQILHVDLINSEGKVVHRQPMVINNGNEAGYIFFPAGLVPGAYLVQAYTDWMKNRGEAIYFRKELMLGSDRKLTLKKTFPVMEFYPEGGSLVAGLQNHVVVKCKNCSPGAAGVVQSNDGGRVAGFQIDENGWGSFIFIPRLTESYRASCSGEATAQLPVARKEGCTIFLTADQSSFWVFMNTKSSFGNKELPVLVMSRGKVVLAKSLLISDSIKVEIPVEKITGGFGQIFVLSPGGELLAQRIFHLQGLLPMKAILSMSKQSMNMRELGHVQLSVQDKAGRPVRGEFSASVINKNSISPLSSSSLLETLLLESDINPTHEDFPAGVSASSLDKFLISKKWDRLNWPEVLGTESRPMPFRYRAMLSFHGEAFFKDSTVQVPDSTKVVLFLQHNLLGYDVYVKDGQFDVTFFYDFRGDDEMFYSLYYKGKYLPAGHARLFLDTASSHLPSAMEVGREIDPLGQFALKKKTVIRSYGFFVKTNEDLALSEQNPNAEFEDELMEADISLRVEDYVVFPTMEDLVREIIPSLQYRAINGKDNIRVILYSPVALNTPLLTNGDPLYIIDGRMTRSTSYFMNLKPGEILTVKLVKNVNKLDHFGLLGSNGVVLLHTRNPDDIRNFKKNTVFKIRGLNAPVTYKVIDHSNTNPRIPDLRNSLYWNPSVKTDHSGKAAFSFYSSDDAGEYIVRVSGISETGHLIYAEFPFTVGRQNQANKQ